MARLADQQAPGVLLSLLSQCWHETYMLSWLLFCFVLLCVFVVVVSVFYVDARDLDSRLGVWVAVFNVKMKTVNKAKETESYAGFQRLSNLLKAQISSMSRIATCLGAPHTFYASPNMPLQHSVGLFPWLPCTGPSHRHPDGGLEGWRCFLAQAMCCYEHHNVRQGLRSHGGGLGSFVLNSHSASASVTLIARW